MFGRKKSHIGLPQKTSISMPKELKAWEDLPSNLVLVHTISEAPQFIHQFFKNPAQEIFSQWDIISTSLINLSNENAAKRRICNPKLKAAEPHLRITNGYRKWGLVLNVPVQNIMGAYPDDIHFPNHIGTSNDNDYNLEPNSRLSQMGRNGLLSQAVNGCLPKVYTENGRNNNAYDQNLNFNEVMPPRVILDRQHNRGHNEIVVIGRPYVNHKYKVTQPITVSGIIEFRYEETNYDKSYSSLSLDVANKLAIINNLSDFKNQYMIHTVNRSFYV